jgi:hypothetical protein
MTKPIEFKDNKYTIRFVLRRAIEWYVFQKNSNPSLIFFLRHKKQNHQKIFFLFLILPLHLFFVPNSAELI